MENNYVVVDYKDNQGKICVIDINNKKIAWIERSRLDKLPVDNVVGNISGTHVFTDSSKKYFGIFQVFSGKLYLAWIKENDFKIDRRKDTIYKHKNIIELGDIEDILKHEEWTKGVKQICVKNLSKRTIRTSMFLNDTGVQEDEHERTKENKEEEHMNKEEDNNESVIGVNKIYSFSGETEVLSNPSDCMYEMLLKMVKVNDSVSVSKDWVSKIKVYTKKTLEASLDYSRYKALVIIKFEEHSEYSILAVIDYDESKEDVRLSIIKPYNKSVVDEHDINTYYAEYTKWRKSNNTR